MKFIGFCSIIKSSDICPALMIINEVYAMFKKNMSKKASAVSIIGGADGPTSIFVIGGKEKNIFRRIKNKLLNWKYQRKRGKAKKKIVAGTHSLDETVQYMVIKYGAYEADASYPSYTERMEQLRCSIIQREKPELIGAHKEVTPPDTLQDRDVLLAWMKKADEMQECMLKQSMSITQETFQTACHLYVIDNADGRIEIETEDSRGFMGLSSSGNIKKLQKISIDIYKYYGVSQEDIADNTPRYKSLLAEMSQ